MQERAVGNAFHNIYIYLYIYIYRILSAIATNSLTNFVCLSVNWSVCHSYFTIFPSSDRETYVFSSTIKGQGHTDRWKFLPCPAHSSVSIWPNHFMSGINTTHERMVCCELFACQQAEREINVGHLYLEGWPLPSKGYRSYCSLRFACYYTIAQKKPCKLLMYQYCISPLFDFYSRSGKTSYHQNSWSTEAAWLDKNIKKHAAHNNVLWHNPKQWQVTHTSDFIMIIRLSTRFPTVIIRAMDKLNTHSPIYCMKDNWANWLSLRHTIETECTWQAF